MVAGNHDHGLVAGWIDGRLRPSARDSWGSSSGSSRATAARSPRRWRAAAQPARAGLAYPGVWLRDDVLAIHGHYSDLHATVPTFERLATGVMARWIVRVPEAGASPDDYEAVLAPMYAWMTALTQRSERAVLSAGAGASARAWVTLAGGERRSRPRARRRARRRLRGRRGGAQRGGPGPAGARPVGRFAAAGLPARDRRGAAPPRRDRAATSSGATRTAPARSTATTPRSGSTPAGTRILNTGSWVYQRHFLVRAPERVALLAGHRRPRRGQPARRGSSACWASGAIGSWSHSRGEAGHEALDALADAELEHAGRVVRVLDEQLAAGLRRPRSRGRRRSARRARR